MIRFVQSINKPNFPIFFINLSVLANAEENEFVKLSNYNIASGFHYHEVLLKLQISLTYN